jgi:hypothetical protein
MSTGQYIFIFVLIVLVVAAIARDRSVGFKNYKSIKSYFNGAILAVYDQTTDANIDDVIVFTFNQPDDYSLKFSITPGKENEVVNNGRRVTIPLPRLISVEKGPIQVPFSAYKLPGHLRVTITNGEQTEFQDFK